jgi:hypothetical protein
MYKVSLLNPEVTEKQCITKIGMMCEVASQSINCGTIALQENCDRPQVDQK